jgi:DNA polymerase III psi subunit
MNPKVREELTRILRSIQISGHMIVYIDNDDVRRMLYNELLSRKELTIKMHNPTHIDVRKNVN